MEFLSGSSDGAVDAWVILACLRELLGREVVFEMMLLRRLEPFRPECGGSPLLLPVGPNTGDDAGELPGVSTTLLVADRSIETIVEMESRNC